MGRTKSISESTSAVGKSVAPGKSPGALPPSLTRRAVKTTPKGETKRSGKMEAASSSGKAEMKRGGKLEAATKAPVIEPMASDEGKIGVMNSGKKEVSSYDGIAKASGPAVVKPAMFNLPVLAIVPIIIIMIGAGIGHFYSIGTLPTKLHVELSPATQHFMSWLANNGAYISPDVAIIDGNGERDLIATTALADDTELAAIPNELLIWEGTPAVSALIELLPNVPINDVLAVFLIRHREDPQWSEYISFMSAAPATTPLHWTDAERALIVNTFAMQRTIDIEESLAASHAIIITVFPEITLAQLTSAWTAVVSRVFGLWFDRIEPKTALVPFLDMANHDAPSTLRVQYDWDRRACLLVTMRDYKAGEAVHTFYGNESDSEQLTTYGFTVEDNLNEAKCMLLDDDGQAWVVKVHDINDVTTSAFLDHLIGVAAEADHPMKAMWSMLSKMASDAMGKFDTSMEEDVMALASDDQTVNGRNAMRVRRSEKYCLREFQRMGEEMGQEGGDQVMSQWAGLSDYVNSKRSD